jgi:hypothetical protein
LRKAVVTAGVSYHYALTRPEGPYTDFEILDVHHLFEVDLTAYALVMVLRSVDSEALWVRRHQFARFLDRGGVLVTFGEAWTNWFPGCRWEAECPHWVLEGIGPQEVSWHAHGVFKLPPGGVPLVIDQQSDAVLYLDEHTYAPGRILAGTLDPDCHTGYGSDLPRPLLRAILRWVFAERQQTY